MHFQHKFFQKTIALTAVLLTAAVISCTVSPMRGFAAGKVKGAENLLVDDSREAVFGDLDGAGAFLNPERRETASRGASALRNHRRVSEAHLPLPRLPCDR